MMKLISVLEHLSFFTLWVNMDIGNYGGSSGRLGQKGNYVDLGSGWSVVEGDHLHRCFESHIFQSSIHTACT